MDDLIGAPRNQVRDGLRLDYQGSPFGSSGGYAVVEIDSPSLAIVTNARVPKLDEFHAGGNDRLVTHDFAGNPLVYFYTGNGLIASVDGRLRPEFHLGPDFIDLPPGAKIRKFSDTGSALGTWQFDGNNWNPLP